MPATVEIFERNALTLIGVLRNAAIESVEISYYGSGDSGECCDVGARGGDIPEGLPPLPFVDRVGTWCPTARDLIHLREEARSFALNDFCQRLVDQAIEVHGHQNYEDGPGGQGTLTVRADGRVDYIHDDFYEDTDTRVDEPLPVADAPDEDADTNRGVLAQNIATVRERLRALGLDSVEINYRGSGDSGDDIEMGFKPEDAESRLMQSEAMQVVEITRRWNPALRGYEPPCRSARSVSPSDILDVLVDQAIEAFSLSGYENNEGGYGCLTIAAEADPHMLHVDYIERSSTHEASYDLSERLEALAAC